MQIKLHIPFELREEFLVFYLAETNLKNYKFKIEMSEGDTKKSGLNVSVPDIIAIITTGISIYEIASFLYEWVNGKKINKFEIEDKRNNVKISIQGKMKQDDIEKLISDLLSLRNNDDNSS